MLYDLVADPGEQQNLFPEARRPFQRLRRPLLEWMRLEGGTDEEHRRRADEIEKELRALGYLG